MILDQRITRWLHRALSEHAYNAELATVNDRGDLLTVEVFQMTHAIEQHGGVRNGEAS